MVYRASQKFLNKYGRFRVFLDDVEILQVYYIDRRRRRLRTFDTRGDGKPHMDLSGRDVERKEVRWKPRQKLRLESLNKYGRFRRELEGVEGGSRFE